MNKSMRKLLVNLLSLSLIIISVFAISTNTKAADSYVSVYRLNNPITGEYLYSTDENEVSVLTTQAGWINEGVEWNAPTSGVAVYRIYNPSGFHLYTSDQNEIRVLTTERGWLSDNNGKPMFYSGGSQNIYRLYHPTTGRHLLTSDKSEYDALSASGWNGENVAVFAASIPNRPTSSSFNPNIIPAYTGSASVPINNNTPFFTSADLTTRVFENYSNLDFLGRCGVAYANICKELMPTEPRGEIGSVRPSGWHTVNYHELIEGNYLYNRCHLIAFSLAGENANEKNLITGTRYMNTTGMMQYEDKVRDYVNSTGHHVLYRVTPVFEGNNLLSKGVLIEAKSVEDNAISFCVFCYNVQPGIIIDYSTGDSHADPSYNGVPSNGDFTTADTNQNSTSNTTNITGNYVLNTNTKVFHYPSCRSVSQMADHNKQSFLGSREDAISSGYKPCGICKP